MASQFYNLAYLENDTKYDAVADATSFHFLLFFMAKLKTECFLVKTACKLVKKF